MRCARMVHLQLVNEFKINLLVAHYIHFVPWEPMFRISSNLRHPFFYKRNSVIGGQGKPATATQWVAARIAGRTTPEVRSVRHFMSARARHVYAEMINQHRKLKPVFIAPLRNFISGAAVCFPSNWSADSAGQSFEYQSSFGSTNFETVQNDRTAFSSWQQQTFLPQTGAEETLHLHLEYLSFEHSMCTLSITPTNALL